MFISFSVFLPLPRPAIVGPLRSPPRYYSLLSHPTHTSPRVLRACRVCPPPWASHLPTAVAAVLPPTAAVALPLSCNLRATDDIHGGVCSYNPHPAPHLGKAMGVHHSPLVAGGPFGGYLAAAAAQQPDLFAARSRSTLPAPPSPRA